MTLASLWDGALGEALEDEARLVTRTRRRPGPGTAQRAGPRGQVVVGHAPILARFQSSLVPVLRGLTGRMLVPVHAWYNRYERDDGIWLHVDVDESEIVALATVVGRVGALHVHPDLRGLDQDRLDAVRGADGWRDDCGVRLAYPPCGVLVQRGREIPHHRPSKPLSEPAVVAALHYRSLFA